ncbi:hypothetical protein JB92DRAFT_2826205 [Gautieria morchelliformis]|nr:hypothetical protein JB92DRAFT_2826205 [Gautieria morchelliformis]
MSSQTSVDIQVMSDMTLIGMNICHVQWVSGALGLLLYMGSLGMGVLITVKNECNVTAQDLGALFLSHKIWVLRLHTRSIAQHFTNPYSLSTMVICHCHLALQERVAHPNGTTYSAHHPITSFRVATQQIHDSLMEEFTNPNIEESGTSEAVEPHMEDDSLSDAAMGIELEEIPHGRETAGAVDGDVHAEPHYVVASMGEVSLEA